MRKHLSGRFGMIALELLEQGVDGREAVFILERVAALDDCDQSEIRFQAASRFTDRREDKFLLLL